LNKFWGDSNKNFLTFEFFKVILNIVIQFKVNVNLGDKMQLQSIDFNEIKPEIYNIVKEIFEEEKSKQKYVSNYELLERIVKVEEELKHQREMIMMILKQMDKRFDQVDKRFEQITNRLDRFMFWTLGLVISATVTIIGYMHYLGK
jgi:hypothetical protein